MSIEQNTPSRLIPFANPPKKAYHTSNPYFREQIAKQGLIPKTYEQSDQTWHLGGIQPLIRDNRAVLFAMLSDDRNDVYDSTYDDDIYEIDLTKIHNQWYHDPNFIGDAGGTDNICCLTLEPIPLSAITLVYQGTGNNPE